MIVLIVVVVMFKYTNKRKGFRNVTLEPHLSQCPEEGWNMGQSTTVALGDCACTGCMGQWACWESWKAAVISNLNTVDPELVGSQWADA